MDPKTNVVKSKSSNSAITTKSDRASIKCRSNVEIQPHVLKKRGVYVEKRSTKLNIHNTDTNDQQDKQVSKPRPDRKKFVASVLTILSKSTTGTQYPDQVHAKKQPAIIKKKVETKQGAILNNNPKAKAKKFKSKVLNNIEANKLDQDLLVLKSRKYIIESTSNYSDSNSFRLPEVSSFVQTNNIINLLNNDSGVNGIAKEVLEGKRAKAEKEVRIDDPITLVENTTNKKADKFYDFFVDLLQTTFNEKNNKVGYMAQVNASAVSSNFNLEIDESVVKKLNVKNNVNEISDDVTQKPSNVFCCKKENNNLENRKLLEFIKNTTPYRERFTLRPSNRSPVRSKLIAQSLIYPKKQLKTESVNSKRSFSNNSKKKALLNTFKEQLKMDLECFEEPQNLYQALKVMARNKRKHQKSLHFAVPIKYGADECMLKRRNVISDTAKLYKKKRKMDDLKPTVSMRKYMDNINAKKFNTARALKEAESYQSLEVHGYDYEMPTKEVFDGIHLSPYHSSPGTSQMNVDALLKYTDSDLSKNLRSISQNMSFYESNE